MIKQEIHQAVTITRGTGCQLFINDYWQEAIDADAFGVHLGQEDLHKVNLETLHESGIRLGVSTHSYEEVATIANLRPSYIALGPIFETTCKSMKFGPQGFKTLGNWVDLAENIPVVAIGGLCYSHIMEARRVGAKGIAAISAFSTAENPRGELIRWIAQWNRS